VRLERTTPRIAGPKPLFVPKGELCRWRADMRRTGGAGHRHFA
jgi:hypothetical protein